MNKRLIFSGLLVMIFASSLQAGKLKGLKRSIAALKTYINFMNHPEEIAGVKIEYDMAFLDPEKEPDTGYLFDLACCMDFQLDPVENERSLAMELELAEDRQAEALAREYFATNELGLMVKINNGGFSIREISGQRTSQHCFIDFSKPGEWPYLPKKILSYYELAPRIDRVHPILIRNKNLLKLVIKGWVMTNQAKLKDQKNVKVMISQDGWLRDLYLHNLRLMDEIRTVNTRPIKASVIWPSIVPMMKHLNCLGSNRL